MNKYFSFLVLASCLMMVSCSQSYKINVNFAGHDFDGKKAFLTNYDTGDTIDSATVSEKHLTFEGNIDSAYYARLIVDGKRFGMVVEPGEINVEWGDDIIASGTALNDKLNAMGDEMEKIDAEWEKIDQAFKNGEISEEEASKQNADLENKQIKLFYDTYVANKDNALGPWAFTNYLIYKQFKTDQLDSLLNTAPSNYRGYKRVIKAQSDAKAVENTAVGKTFTDFTMKAPDGVEKKLSDFVGKDGDFTVVDFWASWCGPCRAEIKGALTKIYEKYNGKGVMVIGVAVWDKPEDTQAAMKQLGIPWQVMMDDHYTTVPTDLYGIAGIPHIMVLDADGLILSRGLQGDALVQYIDQLMNVKK
jgi:thiol-disulfide isomerase/thioredoxin